MEGVVMTKNDIGVILISSGLAFVMVGALAAMAGKALYIPITGVVMIVIALIIFKTDNDECL